MSQRDLKIAVEVRTNKTRYKFRQLSNMVTGASYDIPENNLAIFAYIINSPAKNELVGGLCYQMASGSNPENTNHDFDSEYFHQLPFMFVKKDFQECGVGRKLFDRMMKELQAAPIDRPIHVQSACRAAGFFQKMGFKQVGERIETAGPFHRGHLFHYLVNMEKEFPK